MSIGGVTEMAGMLPAAGAAVPGTAEGPVSAPGPAADEAVLLHLLRVLRRVERSGPTTLTDRALVEAARAAFAALARQSEQILVPAAEAPASAAAAPPQPRAASARATAPDLAPARAPRQPATKKRGPGRGPANPRSAPAM
jgi:hypothetical protein